MSEEDPNIDSINNPDKLDEVLVELGIGDNLCNREGIAFLLESIATTESDPEAKLIEILESLRTIDDPRAKIREMLKIVNQYKNSKIAQEPADERVHLVENSERSRIFMDAFVTQNQDPNAWKSEGLFSIPERFLPKWYLANSAAQDELSPTGTES